MKEIKTANVNVNYDIKVADNCHVKTDGSNLMHEICIHALFPQ